MKANHRIFLVSIVCGSILAAFAGFRLLNQRGSTTGDQQNVFEYTGATPNPFGTREEVFAAVPAEYRNSVLTIKDPAKQLVLARVFASDQKYTGAAFELDALLIYIENYKVPVNVTAENFQDAVVASSAAGALMNAWCQAGPYDKATSIRLCAAGVKLSTDPTPVMASSALGLLRVIHEFHETRTPSEEVLAAIELLSRNELTARDIDGGIAHFRNLYPRKK